MNKKALVMAPHPDDAEFYAGGLIASLIEAGTEVTIITATDGCCGSYKENRSDLIQIRQIEAENAARVLGAHVIMLGYHDYELDQAPVGELREKLVRLIRIEKPDIVVTIDPYASNEAHPDHRTLAWAASDAVNHAGLPLVYPKHLGEGIKPHFVWEKYFYSEDFSIHNRVVDITQFIEKKLEAMKAHESQVVFLVEDFFRQAQIAGIDLTAIPGAAMNDPFQAISFALISQAELVGKKAGVKYAESYRYSRFHAFIEEILDQT
jgi:LmbE family N-acetylglucosaminyl deacetylase